jgi:methylated-DNA-protein-cysteine methyltransferase related protein
VAVTGYAGGFGLSTDSGFRGDVYELVAQIPPGRLMTYGQIAALCGHPRAARIVGGIAHFGPDELPWHRVVSKQGGLAGGFHGGRMEHRARLEAEGVFVSEAYLVDIEGLLWWPQQVMDEMSKHD